MWCRKIPTIFISTVRKLVSYLKDAKPLVLLLLTVWWIFRKFFCFLSSNYCLNLVKVSIIFRIKINFNFKVMICLDWQISLLEFNQLVLNKSQLLIKLISFHPYCYWWCFENKSTQKQFFFFIFFLVFQLNQWTENCFRIIVMERKIDD